MTVFKRLYEVVKRRVEKLVKIVEHYVITQSNLSVIFHVLSDRSNLEILRFLECVNYKVQIVSAKVVKKLESDTQFYV